MLMYETSVCEGFRLMIDRVSQIPTYVADAEILVLVNQIPLFLSYQFLQDIYSG